MKLYIESSTGLRLEVADKKSVYLHFIEMIAEYNGITKEEAFSRLKTGEKMKNSCMGWVVADSE
jgi:hypothetical protein